ncbi:hypothetical protein D1872_81430 [compost metagenome]
MENNEKWDLFKKIKEYLERKSILANNKTSKDAIRWAEDEIEYFLNFLRAEGNDVSCFETYSIRIINEVDLAIYFDDFPFPTLIIFAAFPLAKRGGTIYVSYALISEFIRERIGVDLEVVNADSLHYLDGVGFSVITYDERFPKIKEGERLKQITPVIKRDKDGKVIVEEVQVNE